MKFISDPFKIVLFTIAIISGIVSYTRWPIELFPNLQEQKIIITIEVPHLSPKNSIEIFVNPIYNSLKDIEEITSIKSEAKYNFVIIAVSLNQGSKINNIVSKIKNKIKELNYKEKITIDPYYYELHNMMPVMSLVLYSGIDDNDILNKTVKKIENLIFKNDNISKINVSNLSHNQLKITIDPIKLENNYLTIGHIHQAFDQENLITNQIGTIENKYSKFNVIIDSNFKNIEEINNISVLNPLGKIIRLNQIASIDKVYAKPKNMIYYNGKKAIMIDIFKKSYADSRLINTFIENITKTIDLPSDINLEVLNNSIIPAQKRIHDIVNSLISACIIISIIIFLYLGLSNSVVILCSMLSTFFISCLILNLLNITLNLFVMYSILISLGVMIDNSIVITEYMNKNLYKLDSISQAYKIAIQNMFIPLLTSLVTTLIAFGTLFFIPGKTGETLFYLPLTVSVVLITSFIITILFMPILGAKIVNSNPIKLEQDNKLLAKYKIAIKYFLYNPKKIFILSIVSILLVPVIGFFFYKSNNTVFTSDIESNKIIIEVSNSNNISNSDRNTIMKKVENYLNHYKHNFYGIQINIDNESNIIGKIELHLKEWNKRDNIQNIIQNLREILLENIPGVTISISQQKFLSAHNFDIIHDVIVEVSSVDYDIALDSTKQLLKYLQEEIDNVYDIYSNVYDTEYSEWNLQLDHNKITEYNVDPKLIFTEIMAISSGLNLGKYKNGSNFINIKAAYPDQYSSISMLNQIKVLTKKGFVPLKNFVKDSIVTSPQKLLSTNGQFTFVIQANTPYIHDIQHKINKWHNKYFKNDININYGKLHQEEQLFYRFFGQMILIALIIMFAILYIQFDCCYKALIGISSFIFVILGILIRIILTMQPLNILINSIGIMFLMGIAINNNIILIDNFNQNIKQGMKPIQASFKACSERFMPIFLTSITTILSMLMPALKLNIDFVRLTITYNAPAIEWANDMSIGVIFGMTSSTIASLFIVPIIIAYATMYLDYKTHKKWGDESGSNR